MNNAIKQILNWREKQPLSIDGSTLNRYGVIFNENDGTHTGYFFSVPLYNTYGKNMSLKAKTAYIVFTVVIAM